MGLLDIFGAGKISKQNAALKEALQEKFYSGWESGGGHGSGFGGSYQTSSPFMETFLSGHSGKNYNADPRAMMETYKAIVYAFPVFTAAAVIRKRALGEPRLVSKDKGAQNDLDWISEKMPVTNWKNPYKMQKGLCSLKDRLYTGALMKGTAFCQIKRDGIIPESVEVFKSEWFDVCKNAFHVTEFFFNSLDGGRITILPDGDFQIYSQTVGDFDWGIPMLYGADYMAWCALRMIESRISFEARIGNPPSFTLITATPYNKETGVVDAGLLTLLQAKSVSIKDNIKKMMEHGIRTGRTSDFVDFIPTDGKMEHFTFGNGVGGSANFPEVMEAFLNQLIYKTDTPDFLLQSGTAAAMGSNKYEAQSAQFQTLIEGDREGIEDHLMKPAIAWLIGNKASPKSIASLKIEWEAPNISDLKLKADTEFVSAQAVEKQLLNIGAIMDGTGGGKSKLLIQYLKSIGWDEAIAAEMDFGTEEEDPTGDPAPEPAQ